MEYVNIDSVSILSHLTTLHAQVGMGLGAPIGGMITD